MKTAHEARVLAAQKYSEWYEQSKINFVSGINQLIEKQSNDGYFNGEMTMHGYDHFIIHRVYRPDLFTADAIKLLEPFIEAGYKIKMRDACINHLIISWW